MRKPEDGLFDFVLIKFIQQAIMRVKSVMLAVFTSNIFIKFSFFGKFLLVSFLITKKRDSVDCILVLRRTVSSTYVIVDMMR